MSTKSPAFQFYPKDWLSDANVVRMSNEARGVYIQLMSHCWLEGCIPDDIGEWAALCGCHVDAIEQVYQDVRRCYDVAPRKENFLVHPRLEKERRKQKERRKSAQKAALQRWDGHTKRNANALRSVSPTTSSTSASTTTVYDLDFAAFWNAYPRRTGSNPKAAARSAWAGRLSPDITAAVLLDGAERYAKFCDATGKTGTEYVKQAVSWLSPKFEGWSQDWDNGKPTTRKNLADLA